MLPSLEAAYCVKGRKKAAIAREMEMTPGHVSKWFAGVFYIPKPKRRTLETALGATVDWEAYEGEFLAKQEAKGPAPVDPPPAAPAPARQMPAEAPKPPATAPRRLTGTPPTQKPTPAPVAKKTGGLFGFLTSNDGDLFA